MFTVFNYQKRRKEVDMKAEVATVKLNVTVLD